MGPDDLDRIGVGLPHRLGGELAKLIANLKSLGKEYPVAWLVDILPPSCTNDNLFAAHAAVTARFVSS